MNQVARSLLVIGFAATVGCTAGGFRVPIGNLYEGGDFSGSLGATLGYGSGSAGGESSRSGLMGELYLDASMVPAQHGFGLRGGYQWHYFTEATGGRTRYVGPYAMAYYIYRPTPRLSLYAGVGAVFDGTLEATRVVSSSGGTPRLQGVEVDSSAFRAQVGVRLLAIKFSETVTWSPFIEASYTATGETSVGAFGGGGVTFGATITGAVRRRR